MPSDHSCAPQYPYPAPATRQLRMTLAQFGLLFLSCQRLSLFTPCRSPGALAYNFYKRRSEPMSEDLPDPESRVILGTGGRIEVIFRPNNLAAHERLIKVATHAEGGGLPLVLVERMGIETNSHQCGTIKFGTDPTTSVLDPFCRSHDVSNLFVVDASFFPSSAAVNPALTIAAQALRVADHISWTQLAEIGKQSIE